MIFGRRFWRPATAAADDFCQLKKISYEVFKSPIYEKNLRGF